MENKESIIESLKSFELAGAANRIRCLNDQWWKDKDGNPIQRNVGELLMLVVSELAEAMEGVRKDLNDTHLPQHKMYDVELVDTLIRLLDLMGDRALTAGIDFERILLDKLTYNANRPDHKIENRMKEGGKKF